MKLDTKDLLAAIGLKQLIIEAKDDQIQQLSATLQELMRETADPTKAVLDTPPDGETIVT